MEEVNKNTELDNTDKKLHISDVIDSISFTNRDEETITLKKGKSCLTIKIEYGGNQLPYYTSIETDDVEKLFHFLK